RNRDCTAFADQPRLLVITPVFNEARHIEVVAAAMAAQTRLPDLWVVVDDGSTDGTHALLPELPFVRGLTLTRDDDTGTDGLAPAREIRAFNIAWNAVQDESRWDLIAKVDGDMALPPDYFERLIEQFAQRPRLGMAGGHYSERRSDGTWEPIRIPEHSVS